MAGAIRRQDLITNEALNFTKVLENNIKKLATEAEKEVAKINTAFSKLDNKENTKTGLHTKIDELQKRILPLKTDLADLKGMYNLLTTETKKLKDETILLNKELKQQADHYGKMMRAKRGVNEELHKLNTRLTNENKKLKSQTTEINRNRIAIDKAHNATKRLNNQYARIQKFTENKELLNAYNKELHLLRRINDARRKYFISSDKKIQLDEKLSKRINQHTLGVKGLDYDTSLPQLDRKLIVLKRVQDRLQDKNISPVFREGLERLRHRMLDNYTKSVENLYRVEKKTNSVVSAGVKDRKAYNKAIESGNKGLDGHNKRLNRSVGILRRLGILYQNILGAGLIYSGFTIARNAIRDFVSLDFQLSKTQAVLGETKSGMAELEDQSVDLGRTTSKTASEIEEIHLQLAKLGKDKEQIISLTKSVIDFSIAMDIGTDDAAKYVGTIENVFELFGRGGEIVDKTSIAVNKSQLDFEKLSTALQYIGPSAKQANLSLEETLALVATLSNAGLQGSRIGTSIRRILQRSSSRGISIFSALEQIRNTEGNSRDEDLRLLSRTLQEFSIRAGGPAINIAKELEGSFKEYLEVIKNSSGATELFADILLNNLTGASKLATSALSAYVKTQLDAINTSQLLSGVLRFLARNMGELFELLRTVGIVLLVRVIGLFRLSWIGVLRLGVAIKHLGKTIMALRLTFGGWIGLIVTAISVIDIFVRKQNEKIDSLRAEQRELRRTSNLLKAELEDRKKLTKAREEELKLELKANREKINENIIKSIGNIRVVDEVTKVPDPKGRTGFKSKFTTKVDEEALKLSASGIASYFRNHPDFTDERVRELLNRKDGSGYDVLFKALEVNVQEAINRLSIEDRKALTKEFNKHYELVSDASPDGRDLHSPYLEVLNKEIAQFKNNIKTLLKGKSRTDPSLTVEQQSKITKQEEDLVKVENEKIKFLQLRENIEIDIRKNKEKQNKLLENGLTTQKEINEYYDIETENIKLNNKIQLQYGLEKQKQLAAQKQKVELQKNEIEYSKKTFDLARKEIELRANTQLTGASVRNKRKTGQASRFRGRTASFLSDSQGLDFETEQNNINLQKQLNLYYNLLRLGEQVSKEQIETTLNTIKELEANKELLEIKKQQLEIDQRQAVFDDLAETNTGGAINILGFGASANRLATGLKQQEGEDDEDFNKRKNEAILKATQDFSNATFDILEELHNKKIELLNKERQHYEDYISYQLALAEGNANKQKELNIQREVDEARINKKIAEEEKKQAKRRKAQAIIDAYINTAVAVTRAFSVDPTGILATIVGVLSGTQIALIASQQIPQYKTGGATEEGLGIVGDGGKNEIIATKDGGIYLTPKTPTLTSFEKGDTVFPSIDDFVLKQKKISITQDKNTDKIIEAIKKQSFNTVIRNNIIIDDYKTRKLAR